MITALAVLNEKIKDFIQRHTRLPKHREKKFKPQRPLLVNNSYNELMNQSANPLKEKAKRFFYPRHVSYKFYFERLLQVPINPVEVLTGTLHVIYDEKTTIKNAARHQQA